MKNLQEVKAFLNEGVYDKGIFKAFFLAGGPGSGKSFVTQAAFAGIGLKVVNSDTIFERELGNLPERRSICTLMSMELQGAKSRW